MLPSQGMVGAELGEDRDHHAAHEVAPLGIVDFGDRLLKAVERPLEVARIPGRKAALECGGLRCAVAADLRHKAGPRREPLRLEVALSPVEQLERLGGVPSLKEQAPQLARGNTLRGSSSRALRSDSSSSAAASLSAGEGTTRDTNCSTCAGGIAPVNSSTI